MDRFFKILTIVALMFSGAAALAVTTVRSGSYTVDLDGTVRIGVQVTSPELSDFLTTITWDPAFLSFVESSLQVDGVRITSAFDSDADTPGQLEFETIGLEGGSVGGENGILFSFELRGDVAGVSTIGVQDTEAIRFLDGLADAVNQFGGTVTIEGPKPPSFAPLFKA